MALLRSPLPESATIVAGLISQHDAPVGNIQGALSAQKTASLGFDGVE